MSQLLRKYCEETTLHGVKELFYARSRATKFIWTSILLIGLAMTVFQMYIIVDNFAAVPVKTEIAVLPSNVRELYPPYTLRFVYFTEWVDLAKVEQFDFDLATFFYFMSYFYPIYTRLEFDVASAARNLSRILWLNAIENLYDLAMKISFDRPPAILNNRTFHRFMQNGAFYYVSNRQDEFYESAEFLTSRLDSISVRSVVTFEHTEFYKKFFDVFRETLYTSRKHFFLYNEGLIPTWTAFASRILKFESKNPPAFLKQITRYNPKEEFEYFIKYPNNEYLFIIDKANFLTTFDFNPIGESKNYITLDLYSTQYQYYIYGTLYNWLSKYDHNCKTDIPTKFDIECQVECTGKYKIYNAQQCNLYFLPPLSTSKNFVVSVNDLNQSCQISDLFFDKNLTNITGEEHETCAKRCTSSCTQWKFRFLSTLFIRRGLLEKSTNTSVGKIHLSYADRDNLQMISLVPATSWSEAVASVGGLLGLWLGGSIVSFVQLFYIFCYVPVENRLISGFEKMKKRNSIDLQNRDDNIAEMKITVKRQTSVNENFQRDNNLVEQVENLRNEINSVKCAQNSIEDKIDCLKTDMTELKQTISNVADALNAFNSQQKF